MLQALTHKYRLCWVTYRGESTRQKTVDFLVAQGFDVPQEQDLIMRQDAHGPNAGFFKLDAIKAWENATGCKIAFAIEDSADVIDVLRQHNIPTYQVRDWKKPMPCEAVELPQMVKETVKVFHDKQDRRVPVRTAQHIGVQLRIPLDGQDYALVLSDDVVGPFDLRLDGPGQLLRFESALERKVGGVKMVHPHLAAQLSASPENLIAIGVLHVEGLPGSLYDVMTPKDIVVYV